MITFILFMGLIIYASYKFYNFMVAFNPYDFAQVVIHLLVMLL